MSYVTDHSRAAGNVRVPCLVCGALLPLAEALIDPAGPAFQAYFHPRCAAPGAIQPCTIYGCARGHQEAH